MAHYASRQTLYLISSRASLVFAVQTWLAQSPDQAEKSGSPAWMSAAMARKSCSIHCYKDMTTTDMMSLSHLLVLAVGTVCSTVGSFN